MLKIGFGKSTMSAMMTTSTLTFEKRSLSTCCTVRAASSRRPLSMACAIHDGRSPFSNQPTNQHHQHQQHHQYHHQLLLLLLLLLLSSYSYNNYYLFFYHDINNNKPRTGLFDFIEISSELVQVNVLIIAPPQPRVRCLCLSLRLSTFVQSRNENEKQKQTGPSSFLAHIIYRAHDSHTDTRTGTVELTVGRTAIAESNAHNVLRTSTSVKSHGHRRSINDAIPYSQNRQSRKPNTDRMHVSGTTSTIP